ncbi:MAG: SpoIIE family protein phosphatase [Holosporaceae bacterium]|jgi:sigma-B regulation protein RsbU (phosphoserine phosphatase)|nr:SpoIIE family protein phosphatase [Holosporaceae bacterium]
MLAKILVLDNEEDTQDLLLQRFRQQVADGTYEFSFANNAEEAQKFLQGKSFDIFVSDINVAGIDGISFISQLRKNYPLMRTVVISAYGDINTLRAAMRGGAHDFVVKPIDFKDLSDTLEKTARVVAKLKQVEATTQKLSAISDELDVSAKLQKSILPGNMVKKGCIELWADTIPAAEVGGDFYDYFWLSENKLGIVMADVSGKNVSAAMFALIAKTLIKSFSRIYASPGECFRHVNSTLYEENVATMFVTALYGIVDMEKNEMVYTNAGHLPIVVVHPDSKPLFLTCDPGMALGILENIEFKNNVHHFTPGETILLYTDGVSEAANRDGQEYDNERMLEVLRKNSKNSPRLLTQALIKSIREFADGALQSDDITTLCLKYRLRVAPHADQN